MYFLYIYIYVYISIEMGSLRLGGGVGRSEGKLGIGKKRLERKSLR